MLALTECATGAEGVGPLIVAAPSPTDLDGDPERLLDAVMADAGLPIDRRASKVLPGGRAAVGDALASAYEMLRAARWPHCYVLGVDSLVMGVRLERLLDQGAVIHTDNPDGVVPGEAAVALRLSLRARGPVLATVTGFGSAELDPARGQDRGPLTGDGLALAAERALAAARQPAGTLASIAYDRAGPQVAMEELLLARLRPPLDALGDRPAILPSLSAGEVGAAAGLLAVATLAFFVHKRVVEGAGLCLLSDDRGWRGAAVVGPPGHREG
jgi:3-oxoacyl-[acyl-carrier-protein] synthase-1